MKRRVSMLLAALSMASCGGGDSRYAVTGTLGIPSSTVLGANLIFAEASLNGSLAQPDGEFGVLIDSGSPVVLIDPSHFGQPGPATANDVKVNVDLGFVKDGSTIVTIKAIPALALSAATMIGFGGILGGNVMRDFSIQLDYAAATMEGFCLGCVSGPRDDVASPGTAVSFTLRGGGTGPVPLASDVQPTVTIPPTRIPVTVDIEGVQHPFILDTGASEVSVRTSVFAAMTSDGRPTLSNFPITTVTGDSGASVSRAKVLTVGGEMTTDVPVMTIPGDDLLDGISQELDRSGKTQIDGLLGGSFLRNFLVTIDYPKGQLHLQRYNTQTWQDEFKRVAIELGATPPGSQHSYGVGVVYSGTDAEQKGIRVNNEVWSIDGMSLDGMDAIQADALLNGTPGTTKTLAISSSDTAPAPVNVQVLVEDLIPSS